MNQATAKTLYDAALIQRHNIHILKTAVSTLCGKGVKYGQIMLYKQPLEVINCPDCIEKLGREAEDEHGGNS